MAQDQNIKLDIVSTANQYRAGLHASTREKIIETINNTRVTQPSYDISTLAEAMRVARLPGQH